MLLSKMETTSLKLLFIIVSMIPVSLNDYTNCSLPFGRISTAQVEPIRFDVTIEIMPQRNILLGKTDITINVKKPTSNISLHGHGLEIDIACTMLMKPNAKPRCHEEHAGLKLWEVVHCPESGIMNLLFHDYISLGIHSLHIEHYSPLDKNVNKIIYPYPWTNETRWIVTNMYSSNAIQRLFPNWYDMDIEEYLHMTVKYDISYKIFSSVPEWYDYQDRNVRRTFYTHFDEISTYSITFMFVHGLITNTKQYDMNYLWQEGRATPSATHMHIVAYHTILHFNWVVNIILSKIINRIDHVILPYGPMKSAGRLGLIAYREKDIMYKEGVDSPGKMIDIAKLVSYEMSRQLFIGVMNSHVHIEDKWLDEILASFYSFYIVDKIWLGEEMMELFVVQNLLSALDIDIYLETKPIIHKSKRDDGIDGLLYPLLYHKKAFAIIRLLLYLVTPQKFDEIIKRYVQSRNTNFWIIVEQVHTKEYKQCKVTEIMHSWLVNIHHPEMYFTRNYSEKTVSITKTAINNATVPTSGFNFKIPFTFYSNSHFDNIVFCEGNELRSISTLNSSHSLFVDMEQFGYYRVNYDSQNWLLLADHLQSAILAPIPVLSRAQIVNDAFYFTTAGKIEPPLFFNVIKFLNNETNYIVWYPMFNILSYMSTFLKFSVGESTKAKFLLILNSLLRKVGYEEQKSDNEMTMPLRLLAIKWACEFGHEECRKVTAKKLIAYIHNSEQNIITRWTNWMYCTGMMNVNRTVSKLLWQQGVEGENMEILERLMCIEDENILLHYLEWMSIVRPYEINTTKLSMGKLHRFIIKKHVAKQKVLNFFLNNYFQIIDRFPHDFHGNLTLFGDIVMNVHSEMLLSKISMRITKEFVGYELWSKVEELIEIRRDQLLKQRRKFTVFQD
ncbi:glutamyl aminopeptidase-like [Odontomachus brunneus]|uniref:glutamyl aminopeptidase-like n=1 Tax=Odontomachus brunneus TaxID=486640 RepID=UPI0013F2166D|nr:glutamyl aminopeptidase-like [Odontomachus brunneus]XP_032687731.1 glutamyl aminopeptidase-like [Odontomachus brunneus]XP_032687732.1 glutamyl aminopeptidase-like [Odontomachus brunneus]XP_032687733.1 glutamyl aminopeptidase-like [Odontomachus brunneus]